MWDQQSSDALNVACEWIWQTLWKTHNRENSLDSEDREQPYFRLKKKKKAGKKSLIWIQEANEMLPLIKRKFHRAGSWGIVPCKTLLLLRKMLVTCVHWSQFTQFSWSPPCQDMNLNQRNVQIHTDTFWGSRTSPCLGNTSRKWGKRKARKPRNK